ncbi:hypothetical protein C7M84_015678 [Penaeus vannamei]|uniref:Uncharacterized protein n=1 Tax=Penaeus vannamei TaxID=6689 RepID=A0A3R7LWE6_PENVA|nr:hypothetical protein C7M84_015678 [Penaeus vannamei]
MVLFSVTSLLIPLSEGLSEVLHGEATPGATGFFEVTVGDKLIHSKKNGDGYVDSEKKVNKIIDAVHDALGALVGLFAAGLLNMKHCAENPLLGWHFVEEKRSPFKVALKRSSRAHQEQVVLFYQYLIQGS